MSLRLLGFLFFTCSILAAATCEAADGGIVTVVEAAGRVMRGSGWLRIGEGLRVQEGDVIDVSERGQVQIELLDGGTINLSGPGMLYLAALPMRETKLAGDVETSLERGTLKLAVQSARFVLRVRTRSLQFETSDAIAVLRNEDDEQVFVESGSARITDLAAGRGGEARFAAAGEFWSRENGRPLASGPRPPPAFVAAMPRAYLDALPVRAARFAAVRAEPVAAGDVTFPEAQPWLAGPYRATFVKRLRPRLKDAAFRRMVNARINEFPEWDRILHPEKYAPKLVPAPPPAAAPPGRENRR